MSFTRLVLLVLVIAAFLCSTSNARKLLHVSAGGASSTPGLSALLDATAKLVKSLLGSLKLRHFGFVRSSDSFRKSSVLRVSMTSPSSSTASRLESTRNQFKLR
ncbi:hypothetical protein TorRG33x02_122690 [Trema orientale]|uniref:Transmembrane protein n=1 Tax=Trema orientale TaxID=63057 RepID=A0A2P5F2C2_TREOI|nr:hypothetical protein TorRG33x02_122690 [Trema orientale]